MGCEVIVVTSPMDGSTWVHERDHWLRRNFGLNRDSIIHTNAKHAVAGDLFVDDKTEHCAVWRRCHPNGLAIRWGTYTNHHTPYDGITSSDWDYVVRMAEVTQTARQEHRVWTHRTT